MLGTRFDALDRPGPLHPAQKALLQGQPSSSPSVFRRRGGASVVVVVLVVVVPVQAVVVVAVDDVSPWSCRGSDPRRGSSSALVVVGTVAVVVAGTLSWSARSARRRRTSRPLLQLLLDLLPPRPARQPRPPRSHRGARRARRAWSSGDEPLLERLGRLAREGHDELLSIAVVETRRAVHVERAGRVDGRDDLAAAADDEHDLHRDRDRRAGVAARESEGAVRVRHGRPVPDRDEGVATL